MVPASPSCHRYFFVLSYFIIIKYTEKLVDRALDRITSRKNRIIAHLRQLGRDTAYRKECGEFLCDGEKLLEEAIDAHMRINTVLWKENGSTLRETGASSQFFVSEELFDYASPMINSPGPLFTVRFPEKTEQPLPHSVLVLENVQDPGNVGTVIRTANAFGVDAVVLAGACADPYHPKTVRATMGALFRQTILCLSRVEDVKNLIRSWNLPLYGAVLSERARNILDCDLADCAVAVGSEGRGLSGQLRAVCDGEIIIPMQPDSESLNAAVAASILMWEMRGRRQ